MDLLDNIALGFGVALGLKNLALCFLGCLIGTLIGVLPGVGPVATMSMLLPVTYGIDPIGALIMLAGIYYGAQYGGSTTAILVNMPGESSSVVTCLDGYQMARKGRAGAALTIAASLAQIGEFAREERIGALGGARWLTRREFGERGARGMLRGLHCDMLHVLDAIEEFADRRLQRGERARAAVIAKLSSDEVARYRGKK